MGKDIWLCEKCYYREQSRQACEESLKINSCDKGIINDISPRAECKDHELYGVEIRSRIVCRDFREMTLDEKLESIMIQGLPRFFNDVFK